MWKDSAVSCPRPMTADLTQAASGYTYAAVIRKWIACDCICIPRAGLPIVALDDASARGVVASASIAIVLSRYVHYAYAGKQKYFYAHRGDDPTKLRH